MKSFFAKCAVALALFGTIAFVWQADAQNEGKKKKGAAADPTAAMAKKLESVELTADQKTKLEAINKEHGPKLKDAQAKVDKILTPEQIKARREAQQAAKAAGKKGKEAQDSVNEALKLTAEQKKAMEDAQKGLREAQMAYNTAVAGILTAEQKEKAKIGGRKKNA
jgi:Spy/CpxP family protein refolding chaperone